MRPPGTPRLTPADVHNVAFKKPSIGKRGYDEDEVDAFLDLVEEELIRLGEENHELTLRLAAFESGEQPAANGSVGLEKGDAGQQSAITTAEQPAVDQAPADQAPAETSPAEQAPAEQAPVEQAPVEQAPAQQAPVEDKPAEQVVAEAAAQAPPTTAPLADHHMHAARLLGLAEETAQRLTSEAQADADNRRNSANTESEKLVTDARNASEQMLGDAKNQSETMVADAKNQSETMVAEATAAAESATRDSQLKAEAMDREAQRKYEEVMNRLSEQRAGLEKKIDDLRTYEREYRSRLKGWITEQLAQLDEGAATAVTAPESPGSAK